MCAPCVPQLRSQLNWTRANAEFKEAVNYLKSTGSKKVVAVGFCMGGGLALCAAQYAGVNAASAYYGFPAYSDCQVGRVCVGVCVFVGVWIQVERWMILLLV